LAQKGFVVDAFDISESGIEKLKRLARISHELFDLNRNIKN